MRKATILLYHGDDFEALSEAKQALDIAKRKARAAALVAARLGDAEPDAVRVAQESYDRVVDAAAERAESWVLQAIGHEAFRGLLRDHPPRKVTQGEGEAAKEVVHEDDDGWGFNTETFGTALLLYVDPDNSEIRTVAEPDLEPSALAKRVKRLALGELETLWITARDLNAGTVADPKAERSSSTVPRSDET